jgi:hypothetical protein
MTEQDNEKLTIESDALAEAQAVPADEIIISYKGFDKNLRCRDFQFEIGKTYAMDGEIKACKRGFHACEFPLDVFKYYLPGKSRFCVVKQQGPFGRHAEDTKVASARITVDAEIHIQAIVERAIAWISEKLDPAKVEHATGDRSASSATGDSSASSVDGIGAVAMSIGKDSKSKAAKDGAIVCVYRDGDHNLIHIRAAKVGGSEGIKPDVWYTLDIEGNFTEVEK